MMRAFGFSVLLLVCGWGGPAAAQRLDWDAFERMPVLHNGRVKPIDTVARITVQTVCGRESPELGLDGALVPQQGDDEIGSQGLSLDSPQLAAAREMFPEGRPRKFPPAELLFSWMVEPEKWERVPFLTAGNEDLRTSVLGLPVADAQGHRLKHASPHQVLRSDEFFRRYEQLQAEQKVAQAAGKRIELTGVNKAVSQLAAALSMFRQISSSPLGASERPRFQARIGECFRQWQTLQSLEGIQIAAGGKDHLEAMGQAFKGLMALQRKNTLEVFDARVAELVKASQDLADALAARAKAAEKNRPPKYNEAEWAKVQASFHLWVTASADLARLAREAQYALYDEGHEVALAPALNAAALEQKRDDDDDARPWLSLQTVLLGSDALMAPYPQPELKQVRTSFERLKAVYVDRSASDRPAEFNSAMNEFVAAVRAFGEAVEPIRQALPIRVRDENLLAATAYPPPGATDTEVRYNRLDPFTWTWALALAGLLCFGLAQVRGVRTPAFWTGMALVAASQACTIYGLALRVHVTGWAPVTNMFETVIFVSLVVALLGLWFTLTPLFLLGLQHAWRMTAVPGTREAPAPSEAQARFMAPERWTTTNLLLLVPRLALIAAFLYGLTMVPYGEKAGYIPLAPDTHETSDIIAWLAGTGVLGIALYYGPRAVLAALLALVTVPVTLAREGLRKPLDRVFRRRMFTLAGASVGFLVAYIACFVPTVDRNILDKQIGAINPVLRDNFWLTTHVLTITASYGAGALAWGMGNIALGYYLFGRYRRPGTGPLPKLAEEHVPAPGKKDIQTFANRPPEECASLTQYVYKATQVAVVLLAAGTILGGLWADVSWGRFWGWDPKEVWALIALLIYLAVLHGRYAGLFGNFGLAIGSVVGQSSILMAWYGVNFVLGSGLHSYGDGAGGKWWVYSIVALNWLFALAAAIRHYLETHLEPLVAEVLPEA